jgi:hypothetical protein
MVSQSDTSLRMEYLEKYTKALEEVTKLQTLLRESEKKNHLLELENVQLKNQKIKENGPLNNVTKEPLIKELNNVAKEPLIKEFNNVTTEPLIKEDEVSLATLQKIETIKQNPESTPWTLLMKKSHPGSLSYLNKYAKEALTDFIRNYLIQFYPSENDIPQVKLGTKMIDCIPEDLEDEFLTHLDDAIDNGLLDQKPKKKNSPMPMKRRTEELVKIPPLKKKKSSEVKDSETEEQRSTEEEVIAAGSIMESDLPTPPNQEIIQDIDLDSEWEMIRFMK